MDSILGSGNIVDGASLGVPTSYVLHGVFHDRKQGIVLLHFGPNGANGPYSQVSPAMYASLRAAGLRTGCKITCAEGWVAPSSALPRVVKPLNPASIVIEGGASLTW